MTMKRVDDPITLVDLLFGGALVAFAGLLLVADLVTTVRLVVFTLDPPAVHVAEAPVWYEPPRGRGGGSALRVETSAGRILLTTGPTTIMGTPRSGVDSKRVFPGIPAKVAWIDTPARPGEGTVHYPIRVDQSGRMLLDMEGAAAIARAELPPMLAETAFFGIAFAGLAWWLVNLSRRDARRMAVVRAAWHARRDLACDRSQEPPTRP